MASTKNVQALNNRLDLACRNRVAEFYRQHVTSLAQLEHDKLDTARLQKSIRMCPSNDEPLSLKFLGPAPKTDHLHHHQHRHHQQNPQQEGVKNHRRRHPGGPAGDPAEAAPAPAAEDPADPDAARLRQLFRAAPQTAAWSGNPFAPASNSQINFPFLQPQQQPPPPQQQPQLERSKTFAGGPTQQSQVGEAEPRLHRAGRQKTRRSRTPLPDKRERFYTELEAFKQSCELKVIDSTQTKEAYQFYATLTQAEWRAKLSKIDPEYFKNLADDSESDEND